jgi:uncharacterized membrane protein YdfJ with MMPL/SSD domain
LGSLWPQNPTRWVITCVRGASRFVRNIPELALPIAFIVLVAVGCDYNLLEAVLRMQADREYPNGMRR